MVAQHLPISKPKTSVFNQRYFTMCVKQLYIIKEDDSEIKMIYAMLNYVKYTPRYLKISTLTEVLNTNFVMLMTSSTIDDITHEAEQINVVLTLYAVSISNPSLSNVPAINANAPMTQVYVVKQGLCPTPQCQTYRRSARTHPTQVYAAKRGLSLFVFDLN
jgi:hypothetical protein